MVINLYDIMYEKSIHFKFSGKVAKLFGRESVSSDTAAIFELIKNAHDADAENVEIKFENLTINDGKNARILIKDDGYGMDLNSLEEKWMVIGTDHKEVQQTTKKGRTMIGNKGVGRFATEKLCKKLTMISKPYKKHEELKLIIDWSDYEKQDVIFNDVANNLKITNNDKINDSGLTLILEGLREKWSKEKIMNLRAAAGSLIPPKKLVSEDNKFVVHLSAHEFEDLGSPNIESTFLAHAPYTLIANIGQNSTVATYTIKKDNVQIERDNISFESDTLPDDTKWVSFGSCNLIIHIYPGVSKYENWNEYYKKIQSVGYVRQMLQKIHGVKIYRDGFWVRPYGDVHNDWLGLEGERVQANLSIGNSRIIGFVEITKKNNPLILDTTTRERLIENSEFLSMKYFVNKVIDEMNNYRIQENKKNKELEIKRKYQPLFDSDTGKLNESISKSRAYAHEKDFMHDIVSDITKTFRQQKQSTDIRISELESSNKFYTTLASLGISSAATAHEVGPIINNLPTVLTTINRIIKSKPSTYKLIKKDLDSARNKVNIILYYMRFVIKFSENITEKHFIKKKVKINLLNSTQDILNNLEELMKDKKITHVECIPKNMTVYMNSADYSSIIVNLFTNALKSILSMPKNFKGRIKVTITKNNKTLKIKFSDNGKGIALKNKRKIFNLFFTTHNDGTGLGLSIIKDLLEDYDGTIKLDNKHELRSGATFIIEIPLEALKK